MTASQPVTFVDAAAADIPQRGLPLAPENETPFARPELYESWRSDGRVLIIDPPSGRWWIGKESRVEQGRDKVRHVNTLTEPVDPAYEEYPVMLAVIKNKDCNLGCTYCFAEADMNRAYLTGEKICGLFHQILSNFPKKKRIVFLFSGGEPLLHFKTIREAVAKFTEEAEPAERDRVMWGIMTNGTPITDEVADFFKEYGFNVCVSIDGPEDIHDRNRPVLNGSKGSHAKVEEKLELLTAHGLSYSNICTIVEPEDLMPTFDYQVSKGRRNLYMRPLRMQGRQISGEGSDAVEEYFDTQQVMANEFLRMVDRIVAYNRTHEDKIVEQTIANHVRHLIDPKKTFMCLKGPCGAGAGAKMGVDWEGNLYPCDTLVEFPELQIANATQVDASRDFGQLFKQSHVLKQMSGRRPEHIYECSQCHVQKFCGSGCTATSYSLHGDLRSPSDRCDYERALFEGLLWRFYDEPDTAPLLLGMEQSTKRSQWARPSVLEMCTGGAL